MNYSEEIWRSNSVTLRDRTPVAKALKKSRFKILRENETALLLLGGLFEVDLIPRP